MSVLLNADLSKHSYAFAVPCYDGSMRIETAMGLLEVSTQLSQKGIGHSFVTIKGGALIHNVRNELVYRFMNQTECDTMVWVDADVGFDWNAFTRLALFSHFYPIVAGAYPSRTLPPTFFVNFIDGEEKKKNEHGLLKVDGTGMGFVAIQRQVFEQMEPHTKKYHCKAYPTPVSAYFQCGFSEEPDENGIYRSRGEDIWFFKEAAKLGIPSYIDPGIDLTHTGPHTFDGKLRECIDQVLQP